MGSVNTETGPSQEGNFEKWRKEVEDAELEQYRGTAKYKQYKRFMKKQR